MQMEEASIDCGIEIRIIGDLTVRVVGVVSKGNLLVTFRRL